MLRLPNLFRRALSQTVAATAKTPQPLAPAEQKNVSGGLPTSWGAKPGSAPASKSTI